MHYPFTMASSTNGLHFTATTLRRDDILDNDTISISDVRRLDDNDNIDNDNGNTCGYMHPTISRRHMFSEVDEAVVFGCLHIHTALDNDEMALKSRLSCY
jgi:hypothetical protein